MPKTPKRPRDPAQLAKLMVDIATGAVQDAPHDLGNNPNGTWRAASAAT